MQRALPIHAQSIAFTFVPPNHWKDGVLEVACALRGLLGLTLAKACCFYDAHSTHCDDCDKRAHCHYGQSFKTPQNVQLGASIKVGCVPHLWSLQVDRIGVQWLAKLHIAGMERAHMLSWQDVIAALPMQVSMQKPQWYDASFAHIWNPVTPALLKLKGKSPRDGEAACKALQISIVSKSKMLAAMHGISIPEDRLPKPILLDASWHNMQRFRQRTQNMQDMSGWLLHVEWSKHTPEAWIPWLSLALVLGVGKQTSFGMGRFLV
jgi:hypothetical protein